MSNDISLAAGRPATPREGARWGMLSGLLGTLGMTIASSLLVGVAAGIDEGPGAAFGKGLIFLFFGTFFACLIGPAGGAIVGRVLATTNRTSSAPLVGALMPPVVIISITLAWALLDDGSQINSSTALIAAVAVAYAPFGFLAGKFYTKKTNELLAPLGS